MSETRQRWAWWRYRRGLRTIPLAMVGSVGVWYATGRGYFWPGWVMGWGGVAMGLRAWRTTALGAPDDPVELPTGDRAVVEAVAEDAPMTWPAPLTQPDPRLR